MCLGFQTYAALGFPLEIRKVGEKDIGGWPLKLTILYMSTNYF